MDMCGVAVAVLKPYCLLNCIVKILRPYNAEDRHHKLCGDQRMLLRTLKCDTSDIVRYGNADHAQQRLCITSDAFPVQLAAFENNGCQGVLLFLGCKVAALLADHVVHQFVRNRVNCYDLFLSNTRKVIVECTSVYDILSRFADVRCLINNCRRVSCTCADSSSSGGKDCGNNARAACCSDQLDIRMFHHDIACLKRRMLDRAGDVVRAARLYGCLVYKVDRVDGCLDGRRMRVEYNRISCREHADRVAENRLARVRTRCDRANHSERSHLDEGKSSVSRPCCCCDIFRSRSLLSNKLVF